MLVHDNQKFPSRAIRRARFSLVLQGHALLHFAIDARCGPVGTKTLSAEGPGGGRVMRRGAVPTTRTRQSVESLKKCGVVEFVSTPAAFSSEGELYRSTRVVIALD